ncbi:uncharacterized protein LOC124413787 [Diprion similis]|uniref:uncharacterized protein LOC124413787 n=1 Tax=Diprion similis TaxID=362088 RepID=UPI001EF80850|nr:uncharacterized protein LOC124413787 [Diprion similis]
MSDNAVKEKFCKFNTEDVVAMLLKNGLDHCCEDIVNARIDGEKLLLLTGKSNWWTVGLEPSVHKDLCEFVENLISNPTDYLTDLRVSDEEFSPSNDEDYSSDNEFWGSDFEDEGPRSLTSVDDSYSSNGKEPIEQLEIYSNGESWKENKARREEISPEAEIESEEDMYMNKSETGYSPGKINGVSIVEQRKIQLAQRNSDEKPKIGPKPMVQIPNGWNAKMASRKAKELMESPATKVNSPTKFPAKESLAANYELQRKLSAGLNGLGIKTSPTESPIGSVTAFPSIKGAREKLSRDLASAHAQKAMPKPPAPAPAPAPPDKLQIAKSALPLPKPPDNSRIGASPLASSRSADDSDDDMYEPIDERPPGALSIGELNNGSTESMASGSIHGSSVGSIYHEASDSDTEGNYETPNQPIPERLPVYFPNKKVISQMNSLPHGRDRPLHTPGEDGYEPPIPKRTSTLPRTLPATPSSRTGIKKPLQPGTSLTYPKPSHSLISELSNRPLPSPPNRNRPYRLADVTGSGSQPFTEKPWFHNVRREQAAALVKEGPRIGAISRAFAAAADISTTNSTVEGCFLVRPSSTYPDRPFTLVLWAIGRPYNIAIRIKTDGTYALGEPKSGEITFGTIDALVDYYQKNDLVLKSKGVQTGTTRLTQTPQKKNDWTD